MHDGALKAFDYVVIAACLLGITAIGIHAGFRRHASSEQYFLASKSLRWFTVGAAVFASNISTIHHDLRPVGDDGFPSRPALETRRLRCAGHLRHGSAWASSISSSTCPASARRSW